MLVFVIVLFSTLQVFDVQCKLMIIEPTIPQHEKSIDSIIYMLGSMTPYHPPSQTSIILNSCKASKAMLVMRHGPKVPKEEDMDNFKLLQKFQTTLATLYNAPGILVDFPHTQTVISGILKWENEMSNLNPKDNISEGNSIVEDLGKRWNAKLNELGDSIEIADIEYQSAIQTRCISSGYMFLKGFLENNENEIDIEKIKYNNTETLKNLIQLKKPEKIKLRVKTEPLKYEDAEDVYLRKMCKVDSYHLLDKIQKLLFPELETVKFNDHRQIIDMKLIKTMYLACANSHAYKYLDDVNKHGWCLVFDYNDLKMFEGMHDIQYYYKNGYHYNEMANIGHPMMNYMLHFLSDKGTKKFELFSAHTANCLSLITGFRLFRDKVKLTVENMTTDDNMKDRKWRTSFMANYSCNIMVAVYNCISSSGTNSEKVSIYFNEIPLKMQIADSDETCTQCPIEDVKELIKTLLDDKIEDDN